MSAIPCSLPTVPAFQVTIVTSEPMVVRIQGMCRDPAVGVLGLDDGLIPESDDFNLGMVSKRGRTSAAVGPQLIPRPPGKETTCVACQFA